MNLYPPYDQDECYGPLDLDAGLHNPAAHTIDLGMNVSQRDPANPMIPILGNACGKTMPFAASIIDMSVINEAGVPRVINVREFFSGHAEAGATGLVFDGRDDDGTTLPSGVYFAELRLGNTMRSQKLLMLK